MHAIVRVKKHKSASIASVDKHNRRLVKVPNADSSKSFARPMHTDSDVSLNDLVKDRLGALGIDKHRKDAVVAVELMLTASPDFFRPDKPECHGAYNKTKCLEFVNRTVSFLKDKYKDNLIDYVIHLDEATPHIHAIVVPAVKKVKKKRRTADEIKANTPAVEYETNSLDAKNVFGLKALYELQEEYPAHMSCLGLKRGRKHSRANHSVISNYYNKANESASNVAHSQKREMSYGNELSM